MSEALWTPCGLLRLILISTDTELLEVQAIRVTYSQSSKSSALPFGHLSPWTTSLIISSPADMYQEKVSLFTELAR